MKTSGNFLLVTLNCIVAAIATGLATAVTLMLIVLLINNRTAVTAMKEISCTEDDTQCLVFQHHATAGNDAGLLTSLQSPPHCDAGLTGPECR